MSHALPHKTTRLAVGARTAGACALVAIFSPSCSAADEGTSFSEGRAVNLGPSIAQGPVDFEQGTNTNVSLGGSQDFGFYRQQLEAGMVPSVDSLDAAGFFAEHHAELPEPACGERICLQPMVAVMGNLLNGANCTMLHLGLNSPIAADPGERPPLTLSVVLDTSGSMTRALSLVQDGIDVLVDGLRDQDRVSLVAYSDGASVVYPMTEVSGNRLDIKAAAADTFAGGATNLNAGLELGYEQIMGNYDSGRQNRVILLTDGNPTAGITQPQSILEMSRAFNSDGIGLTTVGIGDQFNIALMQDLALQADGNFYFLESAAAMREVFDEELSFFTVPIAFDLELELKTGSEYSFGRALGTPFWEDTSRGGKLEIPSVFLAHRESAEDVTEDDGRRGGGSSLIVEVMPLPGALEAEEGGTRIAEVEVSFREPGTDERITDTISVNYPYGPGELLREGHFEGDSIATVQKSFVMLNIYVGMEMVSTEVELGVASDDTLARLDNLINAVEDYNEEIQDKDIELDLELLWQLRDNLIRAGVEEEAFEPSTRDAWPAD